MRFNVRVYGLLIENDRVLVSDEYIRSQQITKFPGGGLEFGEGTRDCLIREFREELNLPIEVTEHFYTTDFFVPSAFDNESQVISIYYRVIALSPVPVDLSAPAHAYKKQKGGQSFRWIALSEIKPADFSLVIDQKVATLLQQ